MNYIWELAIRALEQDVDPDEIVYKFGAPFSGYMELSFFEMNEKNALREVEINPYYRYYAIFKELMAPDVIENREIIDVLLDLTIHHLKNIDVLMGMNRKEYYINFVIQNMTDGHFGDYVQEKIEFFSIQESKILANNILNLYKTSESIYLLKDTVIKIFTNAYIFSNVSEKDEIIFYLRTNETKEKMEKMELMQYLFLPFKSHVEVYWEHPLGILGVPDMMKMDGIVMY